MKIKFYHISGLVALIIAAVSASFSIYGLSTLFAGSRLAIIILVTALEIAKILSVTLIYNFRMKIPKVIRGYLFAAILTLMLITSIGVYGFLAQAYQKPSDIIQTNVSKESFNAEQQQLENDRIKNYQDQITNYKSRLTTLDQQRQLQEQRLNRAQEALNRRMIDQARNDIKLSDNEINNLNNRIDTTYKSISSENNKLGNLKQENLNIRETGRRMDVGPLRYLGRLFSKSMDSIVTILILILVCVFDPLAIVLWLSTNAIAREERKKEKARVITKIVEKLPDTPEGFRNYIRTMYEKWKESKKSKV